MNRLYLLVFALLIACSSGSQSQGGAGDAGDADAGRAAHAPARSVAFNMRYGPYPINPGAEGVYCLNQPGPTADTWVSGWRSTSTFTHHVNIWQNTSAAHYGARAECSLATNPGIGFFGVEGRDATVMLGEAPEYAGASFLLPRASDLMWNVHEIDSTSSPGEVSVSVDFFPADPADGHAMVVRGFSLNNSPSLSVPPMTTKILRYTATSPAEEIRILTLSSHVHAHNNYATVSVGGVEVYRSTDWTSPVLERYDSLHGGDLVVPPSTEISWECEVNNTTSSTLLNTNSVQSGEMCIVFGLLLGPRWFYTAP